MFNLSYYQLVLLEIISYTPINIEIYSKLMLKTDVIFYLSLQILLRQYRLRYVCIVNYMLIMLNILITFKSILCGQNEIIYSSCAL